MGRKKKKKKKKKFKKSQKRKIEKKVICQLNQHLADQKIEIKKIKKQPTEKKIYNVNDFVVYPKDGVGKIVSVEKAVIGGIEIKISTKLKFKR